MCRIDQDNYYLDIAETVSERATCMRVSCGAVIVRNDEIISTGFNGAPRGRVHCTDLGRCVCQDGEVPCRGVSAEANALISAARGECLGGTLYLVAKLTDGGYQEQISTVIRNLVINAGLSRVVVRTDADRFTVYNVPEWVFDDDLLAASAKRD